MTLKEGKTKIQNSVDKNQYLLPSSKKNIPKAFDAFGIELYVSKRFYFFVNSRITCTSSAL